MLVDGLLISPTVDEQDGLRIVQRLVILIPQISLLGSDSINCTAGNHLLSELSGIAIGASVPQIDCDRHTLFLFFLTASYKKKGE